MTRSGMPKSIQPFPVSEWPTIIIPPRSRLYCVLPRGIGTSSIEGVTSYIVRLADAHSVHTHTLMHQVILPEIHRLQPDSFKKNQQARPFEWPRFYGNAIWTHTLVKVLGELTFRPDIHLLTLMCWKDVLSPLELIHPSRRWCPQCYADQKRTGQPLFDPLVWSLQPVAICVQHRCWLQSRCPHCQHLQPPLASRTSLDCCSHCEQALDTSISHVDLADSPDIWQQHSWLCDAMSSLLVAQTKLSNSPIMDTVQHNLSVCTQHYGSLNAFAAAIQMWRPMLASWQHRQVRPSLNCLLRLCRALHTTPAVFLSGVIEIKDGIPVADIFIKPRSYHCWDPPFLETELKQALWSNPPLPLRAVSRKLQCGVDRLAILFPGLCKEISARYLAYVKTQGQLRRQQKIDQVRQIVIDLHIQGSYPGMHAVCAALGTTRLTPELQQVWHQTRKELDC